MTHTFESEKKELIKDLEMGLIDVATYKHEVIKLQSRYLDKALEIHCDNPFDEIEMIGNILGDSLVEEMINKYNKHKK